MLLYPWLQERPDCTSHNHASPPASAANEQQQQSAPQANAAVAPKGTNGAFSVSCEIDRDKTAVAAAAVGRFTTGTAFPDRAKAVSDCTDALNGGTVLESNPPETHPDSPGMGEFGCSWHRAAPDSPRPNVTATWISLPGPLCGAPSRADTYMAKEEADAVSPDMRIKSKVYKKLWWQMAHGRKQEKIIVSVVHPSHQGRCFAP